MRILKTILKCVALIVILVVACAGLWLVYAAQTRLPDLDGELRHSSLVGEVRVVRDDWGVPHILADHETDAYFALGYVMAQDRLFQMELFLRLARGEMAELLGPPLVPIDKIVRSFRLRAQAERIVGNQEGLPKGLRDAVAAFMAGINHCVKTQPLPFEFAVLHIPPREFTPVDCLTVAAVLPITFADGLRGDALVTLLKEKQPDLDIDALFPGYDNEVPVTIMETLEEAEAYLKAQGTASPAAPVAGPASAGEEAAVHEGLAAVRSVLASLQSLSERFGPALGSNSWVLGGSRTRSGKPILANDPHVGLTNPSTWYEAHLKYGKFENYGYHLPLIPFPILGHNRDRAWGMTMFANDDVDLYLEKFHPDDPNKVMYKGEWVDVETETETIKVRFGRDRQVTVRRTPHGPVITDAYRLLNDYDGADISLRWIWQQEEYTDIQAVYNMAHARDYDSFAEAVSLFTSPGINVSYADRQGNIAWWAAGLVPIRPAHVNPKQLLDGASGKDEPLGYLPFEENPHLKNPPCGYIVTANNLSTVKPVGAAGKLAGYWQPGDRAGRIEHALATQEHWTIDGLKAVQFDDRAYAAPAIVKCVTEILETATLTPLEQQALATLAAWDFGHNVESTGASIYQVLCDFVLKNALVDEMGEKLFRNYCVLADHWNFFKHFVHEEGSPYWDDVTTPTKETCADIVLRSFQDTVAMLDKDLGGDVRRWAWGKIHTMEFKHPFGYLPPLGFVFNIGPFPSPGAAQVINNMLYAGGAHSYDVIAGPSTRRLIDYADPEHSLTILPTGNSGNFMSPYYDDQAAMFMTGQYRELRLTEEQIEAHTAHELCMKPAGV